jgi:hypothetical protein
MALPQSAYKDRQFLAVIGDEVCAHSILRSDDSLANILQDSVTGILLAGVGVCAMEFTHVLPTFTNSMQSM